MCPSLSLQRCKRSTFARQVEEEMLATLSEQTAAERSSSKTAKDIKGLRRQVREQNLTTVELQNEMAKLQVRSHPLEVAALI